MLGSFVNLFIIRNLSLVQRPTIEIKDIYHPPPGGVLSSFVNLSSIRNLSLVIDQQKKSKTSTIHYQGALDSFVDLSSIRIHNLSLVQRPTI